MNQQVDNALGGFVERRNHTDQTVHKVLMGTSRREGEKPSEGNYWETGSDLADARNNDEISLDMIVVNLKELFAVAEQVSTTLEIHGKIERGTALHNRLDAALANYRGKR